MKIRLTQLDGKLPNLALMKFAAFHRANGDEVFFRKSIVRELYEPEYDRVYGSAIFTETQKKIGIFKANFPDAIVGGTGTDDIELKVEDVIGADNYEFEFYDYSICPEFENSIGFTSRGCRLSCPFCCVPRKEGKITSVNTIYQVWRGEGYPKNLQLLDNDFFGQPKWYERSVELIQGKFNVCFNQGINIRLIYGQPASEINEIRPEAAEMLAQMKYCDDSFKYRRIYTAWDNRKDEKRFFKGIETLAKAGINPKNIMVYMLTNYWKDEDFEKDVVYRFQKMVAAGLKPYPMVYGTSWKHKRFQEWVVRRYYQFTPFEQFLNEKESSFQARKYSLVSTDNLFQP